MLHSRRAVLFGLVLLAVLCSGPALAGRVTDLRVTLTTEATSLSASQDVVVEVEVTNVSTHPVHVLRWYVPADEVEDALFAIARDGVPVSYLGPVYKRPAPTGRDYLRLEPGQTLTRAVELSALYDLTQTGTYAIQYAVRAANLVGARAPSPAGPPGLDALTSNTLYVSIQGRTPGAPLAKSPGGGGGGRKACSNSQVAQLETARTNAIKYTTESQGYLAPYSARSERFPWWFGTSLSERWAIARGHYANIQAALPDLTFDCSCRKPYYAYVYPTRPYVVYLCAVFWTAPATGTDSQAGTLIHETSHFTNVVGTNDYVYGQAGAHNLAITNPDEALDNADNHEYFAEDDPPLP